MAWAVFPPVSGKQRLAYLLLAPIAATGLFPTFGQLRPPRPKLSVASRLGRLSGRRGGSVAAWDLRQLCPIARAIAAMTGGAFGMFYPHDRISGTPFFLSPAAQRLILMARGVISLIVDLFASNPTPLPARSCSTAMM